MNLDPLKTGDICISVKGRDKGRVYAVVKIVDDLFVSVCDGTVRKMQNPKKKRAKHLKYAHKTLSETLIDAILAGNLVDNELHKFLLKEAGSLYT